MTRPTSRRTTLAATIAALSVLVACQPRFPTGSQLTMTRTPDEEIRLSWSAAEELDAGQQVASYQVEINGTIVATLPASTRTCSLPTLTPDELRGRITAYDDQGEWSAAWKTGGELTATIGTAPASTSTYPCRPGRTAAALPSSVDAAALSADGRFQVSSRRITATDQPVTLLDRTTGTSTVLDDLHPANGVWSTTPDLRWFAFPTAQALDAADTDGVADLYVWDRTTDALRLVPDAAEALQGLVSADGSSVLVLERIAESATQPLANAAHIDLASGQRTSLGVVHTRGAAISPDGRFVAVNRGEPIEFLVPPRPYGFSSLQLWDRTTGTTTALTTPASPWVPVTFSADGTKATFAGEASAVVGLGASGTEIAVVDRTLATGATVRRSVGAAQLSGDSLPMWSPDGRWATFQSFAQLDPSDTDGTLSAYLLGPDGRTQYLARIGLSSTNGAPLSNGGTTALVRASGNAWTLWTST